MSINQRRIKLISFVLSLILLIALYGLQAGWFGQSAQRSGQANQPGLYRIDHFVDGDTIAVKMNGAVETVRMIGVDTPETHRPNTPVQCYGPEAADYTKKVIGRGSVRLEADPLDTNRDRYDRLLRYVFLPDGSLLETKLITEGYGFAYTLFPFEKKAEFQTYQDQAQAAHKGLWSDCQVTTDSSGASHTNALP